MSTLSLVPIRALLTVVVLAGCASVPRTDADRARASAESVLREYRDRPRASDVTLHQVQGAALSRDPMRPLLDVLASSWPFLSRMNLRAAPTIDDPIGIYSSEGAFLGGLDMLSTMRSGEVVRVQRLSFMEEYQRFGRGHPQGALVVTRIGARR